MGDVLREREQHHGHEDHNRNAPGEGAASAFPAQLRRLRQERGLSLADLARRTHYSKGYLSKIETGAKPATEDVARRCDQILGAEGELLRLLPEGAARDCGGAGPEAGAPGPQSDGACPYRGLPAFTPQDARWFFGRERATAALVERVFERIGSGPLLLVAPSGAGKSSLLNAGLVAALRSGDGFPMPGADAWPVVTLTPTAHPLDELLECTAKALGSDLGLTAWELRDRPETLLDAVRGRPGGAGACPGGRQQPPPVRPVLLVDQFEELFTLCSDEDERRAFVRVLCALASSRPAGTGHDPAVVVLGVRADFSGSCLDLPELAPVFTDGLFVLPPMSVAELREAITRPAELAGVTLEPGLVPLLLRDAGLRDDTGTATVTGTGTATSGSGSDVTPSGALPLLSHALLATWQQREGATLTVAGYERTGGIQGAIARTAETVFARLYPAEQRTIRRILVRLVHVADGTGATRRRMSRTALMEQLAGADGAAAALDAFVRARLITMDSDTVEITHEALLHAWPRLHGWIHADRAGLLIHQQLAHAAAEWEREGRDPSVLYRGTRLDTARSWAEELDGGSRLSPREEEFLRASRSEEDGRARQARRQVRLQQRMLATLVVLLVLAVTAGGVAYQQRSGALHQERVARSQALAVRSTSLAAGRPEASMLLAEEAYRAEATAEARGALLSTQSQAFSARLGGHGGPVNAVAFAPGNRSLATASSDGTVTLRRVADRRTTGTFRVPGRVRAVAFSPDGRALAATSTDGPVRLWSTAGRRTEAVLPASTKGARAVSFDPRGGRLAVAAADGTVQLWDTAGPGRVVASLTGHTGRVNALAYAPDGRTLVSAGSDRTVRLWDPVGARPLAVLRGHTDEVLGAAFAPDGRSLATGGVDRTVRLWDVAGRRTTAALTGHSDDINAVAYTPDGTTVVSAGGDGTTRLWDVRSGRPTGTLTGHTDYVLGVAVDSGGTVLATAGFDQSVVLWDLRGRVLASRPFTEVWRAAFSPDGRLLATADAAHTVRLWDVMGRRVLATFRGHREAVFSVAFAPGGRMLASAGSDGTIRLWDVARRRPLAALTGHSGDVFSVAFAPDGHTLASAGSDGTIRLWDVARRRPLATLSGHTDFANDVAFSPDGRTLASAGDDLTVRLWDVARRRPAATLTGHTGAVRGVAFGPDGRLVASSGNDGTVRLWDARRHRFVAALTGHTGSVRGIAFSPDGRTLASSGNDRTVRLWDMAGRRPSAALTGHTNAVWGIAFAPGGRTVASSSNDGTVRLWDLDVAARLTEICRLREDIGPKERAVLMPGLPVSAGTGCGSP
ncbi:helix-turn-helix domain-containing protein [Streptomyces formicae]|uniref:Helix-turn-helix domain-containing protein n=1 Tax=Streptomyces formicae TaxID=1616117 RepID=A0ABY3WJL1_9ACTN|nr:helix-turn-helix domain-containing protein [Streptomyces formicae]UNM12779.1 helix-turn-helix domain-containing protein [Streptomyces formicae]